MSIAGAKCVTIFDPRRDLCGTSIFVHVQGRRKMEPDEYIEYVEDTILSRTPESGQKGCYAKVS